LRKVASSLRAGYFDVLTLAVLLVPAFQLYLANRAGIIGLYNDDAMYAVAGRILAEGGDPASIAHTRVAPLIRFPIGFPAILAVLWQVGGRDFSVVPLWELTVSAATIAFLVSCYLLLTRAWGFNRLAAGAAVLVVGYQPLTVKYGASVMSDLVFAALAMGCLAIVEWVRRQPERRVPVFAAGLALGLTVLVRYAAAAAVGAAAGTLLLARRTRAALGLAVVAGAVVAPWVHWVVLHGLYGYVDEFRNGAPAMPFIESVKGATWLLLTQTLPGMVLPGAFYDGFTGAEAPGVALFGPRTVVGLFISAWLLVAGFARSAEANRRLPALYALMTLGLVCAWTGRFPGLAWDLQGRLIAPVAPIMLAGAFEWALLQAAGLPIPRRAAMGLAALAFAGWTAFDFGQINARQIAINSSLTDTFLKGLLAVKAYVSRMPPDVRVGAYYPFQMAFYMERPVESIDASARGLLAARDRGIRVVVAMPRYRNEKDQMFAAVKLLLDTTPPQATVLFAPTDFMAVVHLPADPANPPAIR